MIINGLANLLSMNIDIGLKHFMLLSDDQDPGRRAIFCRVVSRVMDLGGKIETNNYSAVANRRTKIGEVTLIKLLFSFTTLTVFFSFNV